MNDEMIKEKLVVVDLMVLYGFVNNLLEYDVLNWLGNDEFYFIICGGDLLFDVLVELYVYIGVG